MTGLAGRRAPNSYNYNYQHVAQHEDQYLSPTDTDDASSVELLDVESACKAYSHRRSRSNSSLSSILSSFAPGSPYLRSHSPRVRLLRRLIHVFVIAFLLWIILTPILNPSYLYRPYHYSGRNLRRENVFIAANIVDEDLIRGAWGNGIVELVDLLGPEHVFLSIFENDSGPGTKAALQHNLGLGGAVVVTVYRRADGQEAPELDAAAVAGQTGLGYNPAVEARGFTAEQARSVRSRSQTSEWALQDTQDKVLARF